MAALGAHRGGRVLRRVDRSTPQLRRDDILAVIDRQLFWMDSADAPHTNPDFYVSNNPIGPALSPDVYVTRPHAPVADRIRAYIVCAKAVPGAVAQIQANLHPPLERPLIDCRPPSLRRPRVLSHHRG